MKNYTDGCKEQIQELDFEQIKALEGAGAFSRIRAYVSTIRKNSLPVLEGILAALNGAPLIIP
jgi:hypothetical protein